ncbi:hypothetical protein HDE_01625 [Halotydeus destructor]|nr:hypothetical protein HDE_01625 [Halotydeus destructor]
MQSVIPWFCLIFIIYANCQPISFEQSNNVVESHETPRIRIRQAVLQETSTTLSTETGHGDEQSTSQATQESESGNGAGFIIVLIAVALVLSAAAIIYHLHKNSPQQASSSKTINKTRPNSENVPSKLNEPERSFKMHPILMEPAPSLSSQAAPVESESESEVIVDPDFPQFDSQLNQFTTPNQAPGQQSKVQSVGLPSDIPSLSSKAGSNVKSATTSGGVDIQNIMFSK